MKPKTTIFRPITILLSALVLLGLALVIRLVTQGASWNEIANVKARSIALPAINAVLPPMTTDFTTVRLRSVFYATREFYVAPVPSMMPPPPPKPNYVLSGTMHVPGKPKIALLVQADTKAPLKVVEGGEVEGWRVKIVEATRVVLQLDTEIFEIVARSGAKSPSLVVQPLVRNTTSVMGSGVRMLGKPAPISTNVTAPTALLDQPRLYSPPPG